MEPAPGKVTSPAKGGDSLSSQPDVGDEALYAGLSMMQQSLTLKLGIWIKLTCVFKRRNGTWPPLLAPDPTAVSPQQDSYFLGDSRLVAHSPPLQRGA